MTKPMDIVCFVVMMLGSLPAQAQYLPEMGGTVVPSSTYTAPGNLFSVQLPPEWVVRRYPHRSDLVELLWRGNASTAWMHIQRVEVGADANPRQMLLRSLETRLKDLPHFREKFRRNALILNGGRGANVVGEFWYQGNAQYPRAVEELFLVYEGEAFVFHFECFAALAGQLSNEVNAIYQSFVPHPSSSPSNTAPNQSPSPFEKWNELIDKIPF